MPAHFEAHSPALQYVMFFPGTVTSAGWLLARPPRLDNSSRKRGSRIVSRMRRLRYTKVDAVRKNWYCASIKFGWRPIVPSLCWECGQKYEVLSIRIVCQRCFCYGAPLEDQRGCDSAVGGHSRGGCQRSWRDSQRGRCVRRSYQQVARPCARRAIADHL